MGSGTTLRTPHINDLLTEEQEDKGHEGAAGIPGGRNGTDTDSGMKG